MRTLRLGDRADVQQLDASPLSSKALSQERNIGKAPKLDLYADAIYETCVRLRSLGSVRDHAELLELLAQCGGV